MGNITPEMAKQVALSFVEKRHNPLGTNGYFNLYFVVVGIDLSHKPNSIYAEPLFENQLEVSTVRDARKYFYKNRNSNTEYLIKVTNQMEADFVYKPQE